jgi:hypothetical protein
MRQAARSRGRDDLVETAEAPDEPELLSYLWAWFLDLHAARPAGGMGPGAITYEAIVAYQQAMHRHILPWEVRVIKAIDSEFLSVVAETKEERRKRKEREKRQTAGVGWRR